MDVGRFYRPLLKVRQGKGGQLCPMYEIRLAGVPQTDHDPDQDHGESRRFSDGSHQRPVAETHVLGEHPEMSDKETVPTLGIELGATDEDIRIWEAWQRTFRIMSSNHSVEKPRKESKQSKMTPKEMVESLRPEQREALIELLRLFDAASTGRKP